jgi:hypothetical protein
MSGDPSRPDVPDLGGRWLHVDKMLVIAGLALFGIGVGTNLVLSVGCAFGDIGHCGRGTGFLLFGAAAFVLAGVVVGWKGGRPVTGVLVALCGVVSAMLMRSFWTTSGPWLFLSAIPAFLATWRILSAPPVIPDAPDDDRGSS